MVLCILGRQPELGMAELERLYGATTLTPISEQAVLVAVPLEDMLARPLGGTMKIAEVLTTINTHEWRVVSGRFTRFFGNHAPDSGKITIGISAYNFPVNAREVQKLGVAIKQTLKSREGSIRVIPQENPALNTAQVLHNKLGTNEHKKEIIFVKTDDNQTIIAETKYVQDIEAYTFRDRSRPKRDAFVGMLPPKLAQIMINLGTGSLSKNPDGQQRILDPFCGTGVVLQEAALMRYAVYGTDLSEKMIRYTRDNLNWLSEKLHISFNWYLHEADATAATWQHPVDAVVCETYLGTPFSTEPSPEKLESVRHDCNVITKKFLQNLAPQLAPDTPLCIAVPAWHTKRGVKHLPVLDDLEKIGYNRIDFTCASHTELIYHREDQVVGRELLVLTRS